MTLPDPLLTVLHLARAWLRSRWERVARWWR